MATFEIFFLFIGILVNLLNLLLFNMGKMINEIASFFEYLVNIGKDKGGESVEVANLVVKDAPLLIIVCILLAITVIVMVIAQKGSKVSLALLFLLLFFTLILSTSRKDLFFGVNVALTLFALVLHIIQLEKTR
ncbi:hypothetical protein K6959_00905 [Bacillus aquiflavi]|uniref:hypothetical protein n=1 Tax=Bacillus aquiflavi TaxID=2672567 RepID=UPI001CA8BD0F|nr:hypothetical protein [Bacillus aquiflavi]UAC48597.1 hypothetical protein K6959_00905 [Bacillus aquiflavi]